jgi:hypothetical protein
MSWLRGSSALLLAVAAAWSPLAGQSDSVRLLVTNSTCTPGPCQTVKVLAFPQNFPRTPGGRWRIELGTLSTASACFAIPPESKFLMVEQHPNGVEDTSFVRWTSRDSLALGTLAPDENWAAVGPSTGYFVPQRRRGWRVALPGVVEPEPARPCRPQGKTP